MNKAKTIIFTILALFTSVGFIFLEDSKTSYYGAEIVYRVYLDGKSLGIIKSKEELEEYIDKDQQVIKEKYNVDKVYSPRGLEIKEEMTYNEDLKTAEEIYETIKDKDNFTIKGYKVTISTETKEDDEETKKVTKQILYILHKEDFINAINSTVKAFINENDYEAYLNDSQTKITDTGTIIKNVYIKESVTIKEDNIPVSEEIFTNEKDLAQYILFGTMEHQQIYTVKAGDTPTSIAAANNLNINEFLVANKDLSGKDSLLYEGQQVIISLIRPIITIVKETFEVENQNVPYTTRTVDDNTLYIGETQTIQEGVEGLSKISKTVKRENGEFATAYIESSEVITEPIEKVVKKGTKPVGYYTGPNVIATTENWSWPTKIPYILTSEFLELRSYERHPGIDISGTGFGSPIYAANDGTIMTSKYSNGYGYYIEIDHGNGFITLYGHCSKLYVTAGETVSKGQVIAAMGSTGWSTGTHLHFEVTYNGKLINPFSLYQ